MIVLILITPEAIRIIALPDMATCLFMASQVAHMGLVACGAAGCFLSLLNPNTHLRKAGHIGPAFFMLQSHLAIRSACTPLQLGHD
jgi:hypothetical protein